MVLQAPRLLMGGVCFCRSGGIVGRFHREAGMTHGYRMHRRTNSTIPSCNSFVFPRNPRFIPGKSAFNLSGVDPMPASNA